MVSEDVNRQSPTGSAQSPYFEATRKRANWRRILLTVVSLTVLSSVGGIVIYNWYFDSVLNGLAYSLQPISHAFHQLNGEHLKQTPSQPAN